MTTMFIAQQDSHDFGLEFVGVAASIELGQRLCEVHDRAEAQKFNLITSQHQSASASSFAGQARSNLIWDKVVVEDGVESVATGAGSVFSDSDIREYHVFAYTVITTEAEAEAAFQVTVDGIPVPGA